MNYKTITRTSSVTKILTLLIVCFLLMQTATKAQYANVPLTSGSFNDDAVANGVGPGTNSTTPLGELDGTSPTGNYVFMDATYAFGGSCTLYTAGQGILPSNNLITSSVSSLQYQLQNYSGNNVLRIPAPGATGTIGSGNLHLQYGIQANNIYILALAGGGAITSGITFTVHFTDSTTYSPAGFTNVTAQDWCGGSTSGIVTKITTGGNGSGEYLRAEPGNNTCSQPLCDYLYDYKLALTATYYTKTIAYISVSKTVASNNFVIFAVGAQLTNSTCTAPSVANALSVSANGSNSITGTITDPTTAPSGYLVLRTTTNTAPTAPVQGDVYPVSTSLNGALGAYVDYAGYGSSGGTSFTSTGLSANTTYYYWVYSYNTNTSCGIVYSATPVSGNTATTTFSCASTGQSGLIQIGASEAFTNLTSAFAFFAANGLTGAATLELEADYNPGSETYPIVIPAVPCASSTNWIRIHPNASLTSTIRLGTATSGIAAIDFNGAQYVTIDGRPGGTGSTGIIYIADSNVNSTASIRFINGADYNKVNYCDVRGDQNTIYTTYPLSAVIFFEGSATKTSTGNSYDSITYCNVHATANGNPSTGIASLNTISLGGTTADNQYDVIQNNNIYDFFSNTSGVNVTGILISSASDNFTIANNSLYESATYAINQAVVYRFMWLNPNASSANVTYTSGFTVSGNYMGGSVPDARTGTGTTGAGTATATCTITSSTTLRMTCIDQTLGNGTATTVSGNVMQKVSITCTSTSSGASGVFTGIYLGYGNEAITGNYIGGTSANSIAVNTGSSSAGSFTGITVAGGIAGLTLNVTGNTINNATISSATAGTYNNMYGIYVSATTPTINIGTVASPNIISNFTNGTSSTTATTLGATIGIDLSTALVSPTVVGNSIYNLLSYQRSTGTGTSSSLIGIYLASTSTTNANISNNTIYNISNQASVATAISEWGMVINASTTGTTTIANNLIHSLAMPNNTSTASVPVAGGIDLTSGSSNVYNNAIRLGYDVTGTAINKSISFYGIQKGVGQTCNFWFNTIYIDGPSVSSNTSATNTAAFYLTTVSTADVIEDNVFVNLRSNASSTTPLHYCIEYVHAVSGLTLGYNVYQTAATTGTTTGNYFGVANATVSAANSVAAYAANWSSTGDIGSYQGAPNFVNATGSTSALSLNVQSPTPIESAGIAISAVTTDILGNVRGTNTPTDIGAYAGNFTSSYLTLCSSGSFVAGSAVATSTACNTTLSLSGQTTGLYGISYQWQSAYPSGSGNWVNISGATSPTSVVNFTQTAATDYQCVLTCSAGGTATSNPVTTSPSTTTSVANGFTPLTLTGYNKEVIAHSPGGTTATGVAGGCNVALDGGSGNGSTSGASNGWNYFDASYTFNGVHDVISGTTYSLPLNGQILSSDITGLVYQLVSHASGTGNNDAMQLRFGTQTTGNFHITGGVQTTGLYFIAVSGNSASTVTAIVKFSDSSSQTFTGISVGDWFNVTPYAQAGFDRVNSGGFGGAAPTNPRMYDFPLTLSPSNYSKTISYVNFTNNSAASANSNVLNIFAMSAATATPANFCASGLGTSITLFNPPTGATLTWQSSTTSGGPYTTVSSGSAGTNTTNNGVSLNTYTNSTATGTVYYVCQMTCPTTSLNVLSDQVTVTVNPVPTITATASASYCSGTSGTTLTASGGNSYTWAPAPSSVITTSSSQVLVQPTATTTYTVTGLANGGCTGTAQSVVTFNTGVVISGITASTLNTCGSNSATLTLNSTGATTYSWSPNATLNNSTSASVVATPVNQAITYTVTGSNTNCSNTATVTVTNSNTITGTASYANNNPPTGYCTSFSPSNGCASDGAIEYLTISTGSTTVVSNQDQGGCIPSGNQYNNLGTTYSTNGFVGGTTYTIAITGYFTSYTGWSAWIDYNQNGVFDAGEQLMSYYTNDNTNTYTTTFTVPTSAYNGATKLRVRGDYGGAAGPGGACNTFNQGYGEVQDYTINITGGTAPTPPVGCPGAYTYVMQPVFSGGGTPYTYSWAPSTGLSSSTVANPTVTPVATTTYTLTVSDACGDQGTATVTVVTTTPPAINVTSSNANFCPGGSSTLSASGDPVNGYNWSPAAGLSATTGATVTATPTTYTTYTITGTSPTSGCTGTGYQTVSVISAPTSIATSYSPTTLCALGTPVTLTATGVTGGYAGSGSFQYRWDSAGIVKQAYSPTGTSYMPSAPATSGVYTYYVIVSPTLCPTSTDSAVISFTAGAGVAEGFTPLSLTGFNKEVIATGCPGGVTGTIGGGTTTTVDGSGYNFFDATYCFNGTSPTNSLPANGQIISSDITGLIYQLVKHNGVTGNNDVLQIPTNGSSLGSSTGTLTLSSPASTTALYVLAVAGNAGTTLAYITAQVNFSDGSNQTFTGLRVYDWFNNTPYAQAGFDRVGTGGFAGVGGAGGNPRMYDIALTLSPSNYGKTVNSITFTNTSTYTTPATDLVNIFAVSYATPTPNPVCISGSLGTSITLFNAPSSATFQWQSSTSPTGPFTNVSTGGAGTNTTVNGVLENTYTNTTPANGTTYYQCQVTCTGGTAYSNVVAINVNAPPTVTASPSTAPTICTGNSATLSASGASTYTWSPTVVFNSTDGSSISASPTATTTYTVTGINAAGCTATATEVVNTNPGVIVSSIAASPTAVCGTNSSILTVTATSTAGTISYAWSPAVSSTASTASVTPAPNSTVTYTVVSSVTNGCSTTSTISVTNSNSVTASASYASLASASYCTPPAPSAGGSSCFTDGGISSFTITDASSNNIISNSVAGCVHNSTAYNNLGTTYVPGTLAAGQTYNFSIGNYAGYSGYTIWIDYNEDNTFESTEAIYNGGGGTQSVYSGSFIVPLTAVTGSTRLRITGNWGGPKGITNACGAYNSYGETQDYTVSVTGGVSASCPGVATYQITSIVSGGGAPYTYSWAPTTGLSSATIANPTVTPVGNTTYTLTILDACNDPATANVTFTFTYVPTITSLTAGNNNVCAGSSTTLTASGSGLTNYYWSPVSTISGSSAGAGYVTGNPVTVTPTAVKTTYTVFASGSGCYSAPDTITVFGIQPPTNIITSVNPGVFECSTGTAVTLSVSSSPGGYTSTGNYLYQWTDLSGNVLQAYNASSSFTPASPASGYNAYKVYVAPSLCPSLASSAGLATFYEGVTTTISAVNNPTTCGPTGSIALNNATNTWYNNNFSTTQTYGATLYGSATILPSGSGVNHYPYLMLTPALTGRNGSISIPNPGINPLDLQVTFNLIIDSLPSAFGGADGFSYSFADDAYPTTTTPGLQFGTGTKLSIGFQTYSGGSSAQGIYLYYGGTQLTYSGYTGFLGSSTAGANSAVSVSIDYLGNLTLTVGGNAIFTNYALPSAYLSANKSTWRHVFSATCGGDYEAHDISNLNIQYTGYQFSINSTNGTNGTWVAQSPFSGLSAGTYSVYARSSANPSCYQILTYNGNNTVTLNNPAPPSTGTVISSTPVNCGSSSPLTIGLTSAVANASFSWSPTTALTSGVIYNPGANPTVATTYTLTITDNSTACTSKDTFKMSVNTPVSVTTAPVASTICLGSNTTFSVSATGTGPLTYQWQDSTTGGWSNITASAIFSNVTTATLSATAPTVTYNGYRFRCIVGGASPCGTTASKSAKLTINTPAAITAPPSNKTICLGISTTFSVSASGTGPLTYQWQDSTTGGWNNITASATFSNVTTTTLSVTSPILTYNGYKFRCVVTGTSPCGSVISPSATLAIHALPTVKFSPYSNLSICTGPVGLPVTLTGASPFTMVYNDGSNNQTVTGVTNTYSLNVNPLTTTTFHIRSVTDNIGCAATVIGTSANAYADSMRKVVLFSPKGGSVTPALSTVCSGSNQTFSITGDTGTHIQWQYSTSPVSNSTSWTDYGTLDSTSATLPNITGTTYVRAVISVPGCVSVSSTDGTVQIDSSAIKVSMSNISATAATVNWTPALGATSYTIVYNGNTVVAGNVTSYNLTGLSSCTAYSVSVTSNTSNCGGARSGSGSFNTPTGNLTLSLSQGVTYKVTATWNAGVGPYKLYIGSAANLNSLQVFNVTGTTYTTTNAWPGYTVAAYVVDLGSTCTPLAQSPVKQINVAGGSCTTGAPVITARATTATTFTVQWSGSATGYQFYYKNTNGSGSWYSYYTAGNSMTINGCAPGNCYAVYVQNVCGTAKGYATAVDTLCTASVCGAPLNLILSKATCNGFTATWNSVAGATAYQVFMTLTSASGSPIVYSYTVKGSPYTVAIFGRSVPVSVYVKTLNCTGSNGISAASNVESITTLATACKDDGSIGSNDAGVSAAIANGTFSVYPNPNNGTFKVSMATLSTNSVATLEVMDLLGRTLYTKEVSNNNGTIVETIDMGNAISSGLYMVRVRCGNDIHITKVQIQR